MAVRDELSEENMLEPRVAEDIDEYTLAWSKELRAFVEESAVE